MKTYEVRITYVMQVEAEDPLDAELKAASIINPNLEYEDWEVEEEIAV